MKGSDYKSKLKNYFVFMIGTLMVAFGVSSILKPSGLIIGGATGISILVEKVTNIRYTYVLYVVSLLVLLLTFVTLGTREVMKILVFSIIFPPIIMFFDLLPIQLIQDDMLLCSIYFGLLAGVGSGLILKAGFSQGATDTVAKIMHIKWFPFIGISQMYIAMDIIIVFASVFILDKRAALYGVLTEYVMTKSMDFVLVGLNPKKVRVEIISDQYAKINDYIHNTIIRGTTVYEIKGGYTNQIRNKIETICSLRQAMDMKAFIAKVDEKAFVEVFPVTSVWGKGVGFESIVEED